MKKFAAVALAALMLVCAFAIAGCKKETDPNAKSEGVMTYAEYDAAALDSEVVIETYVQAHQSWWDGKITCYTQDQDGGYFLYNMTCSEEDAEKLVPGTKIKVTGYKAEWAGEVELAEGATFEIEDGSYIAEAEDVTSLIGSDDLLKKQNKKVCFKGLTVTADAMYNWDGSGAAGDDVYFTCEYNGNAITFCVESYLCGDGTECYDAAEALKAGDTVDIEGFLYWYEGAQPHVTSVTVK